MNRDLEVIIAIKIEQK